MKTVIFLIGSGVYGILELKKQFRLHSRTRTSETATASGRPLRYTIVVSQYWTSPFVTRNFRFTWRWWEIPVVSTVGLPALNRFHRIGRNKRGLTCCAYDCRPYGTRQSICQNDRFSKSVLRRTPRAGKMCTHSPRCGIWTRGPGPPRRTAARDGQRFSRFAGGNRSSWVSQSPRSRGSVWHRTAATSDPWAARSTTTAIPGSSVRWPILLPTAGTPLSRRRRRRIRLNKRQSRNDYPTFRIEHRYTRSVSNRIA